MTYIRNAEAEGSSPFTSTKDPDESVGLRSEISQNDSSPRETWPICRATASF